jgi:hypothetical protein
VRCAVGSGPAIGTRAHERIPATAAAAPALLDVQWPSIGEDAGGSWEHRPPLSLAPATRRRHGQDGGGAAEGRGIW